MDFEIPCIVYNGGINSYDYLYFDPLGTVDSQHERPDHRSGLVRSVVRIFGPRFYSVRYVVRILVRNFIWSGPWSGFSVRISLVRYVVRNSVRKSAPGRIIRTGPDFGPGFQTDGNSKKKILNESGFYKH